MEKVFCMQVAAMLTQAACNGLGAGSNRPIDPTLQDPTQRACNLEVWEIFRAYYAAVTQALADNADWPAPTVAQGTTVPSVISAGLTAAAPAISAALGGGPLGSILQSVLKALPAAGPKPAIQGPIPNPGTTASKPSATASTPAPATATN
jgi:hypothetical protein